jgi:hypothetical protein
MKMGLADELAAKDGNPQAALELVRVLNGKSASLTSTMQNIGSDWILSSVKNVIARRQAQAAHLVIVFVCYRRTHALYMFLLTS